MSARRALGLACAVLWGLTACRSTPEPVTAPGQSFLGALELPSVGPLRYQPADLSGRVVLVTFFATWCFPCVVEVPTLMALQRDYGPRGLQVVGVGMDLEGWRVLAPFAEHYELNYPVLVADERIRSGQGAFGSIGALPTTVILDRDGRAVAGWQGAVTREVMAQAVEKALKQ